MAQRQPIRIVLADPPDIKTPWLIANHPNLGILYLASYLRSRYKDIEIRYLETNMTLERHLEEVEVTRPHLYGISYSTLRRSEAHTTMGMVRERFPSLPIICGGAHPTIAADEILRETPADICVVGEGEETLSDLVEALLLKTKRMEDIPGIVFRHGDGTTTTPGRGFITDLDTLPFPAWDLIDFTAYVGNYQYKAKPSTALIASRGCPFNCTFCSNPVWKSARPWVRLRSPGNVAAEVDFLYGRGIREISIRSDEFNVSVDWAVAVCREIRTLGHKDLYFQANFRADKFTDELAEEMRKANFWLMQLGIESGNQRVLDGIRKKITVEQIVNTCEVAQKHGLKVYGYIMIYNVWEEGGTLCYETPAEVDNTLSFVRNLKSRGLLDYMSFSTATPIRGAALYEIAGRHGIMKRAGDARDLSDFRLELPGITERQMRNSRLKGMLIQLYFILRSPGTSWADRRKIAFKVRSLLRSLF